MRACKTYLNTIALGMCSNNVPKLNMNCNKPISIIQPKKFSNYTMGGKVFGGTKPSKSALKNLIQKRKETVMPKMILSKEDISNYSKDKNDLK
jgi:hypothetical protein